MEARTCNIRFQQDGKSKLLNTGALKPGIQNPESGIRNPESGIHNLESRNRITEMETETETEYTICERGFQMIYFTKNIGNDNTINKQIK